ncbi:outer envelope pore protein 21B, chloroplastic-like [Mercurialis annua]|uniref:outer envelope pore protein 21B, chloroplastic-like n=1 Tax=Mercurialis annua TaxID=3986 RepID=UPI00215E8209|nr:outer envelope pore protein 21B, chloroplastic-like [Mercurialis annua]
METSLRYGGDSTSLKIHAKEKFPLDSKTHLQVHGELDTRTGAPSHVSAMIRRFYPDFSASLGVGVQYDKRDKLNYRIRGKKAFPITSNALLTLNLKGWCNIDKDFKERKSTGAAEFSWSIFNFRKDQDVRFKIGYQVTEKGEIEQQVRGKGKPRGDNIQMINSVPYMQIRENNWTLNADLKGRWNVRFDL